MSQADYRNAVKTGASIDWRCLTCDFPRAENTALSENLSEISASANPDADLDSEETTGGLAQWTEPARQRTITAAPVNPDPGTSPGSYTGQHADPSGFRQKAEETSAVKLPDHAEKTLRPLESIRRRPKEFKGASGGLRSPRTTHVI